MNQPNHLRRLLQLALLLGVIPLLILVLQWIVLRPPPVTAQSPGQSCHTNIIPATAGNTSNGDPDLNAAGDRTAFWTTGNFGGDKANPDGNVEVFWADIADPDPASFLQATQTGGNILGGFNLGPRLSRDGDHLIFYSDDIMDSNLDGNFEIMLAEKAQNGSTWTLTQVTDSGQYASIEPTLATSRTFLIAFVSDADLTPPLNSDHNFEIFTADLGGAPPFAFTQVTDPTENVKGGFTGSPSISADGKFVAFASDRDLKAGENGDQNSEIFLYAVETKTITQLTRTTGRTNKTPSISDAGDRIAYTVENPGGDSEIWLYQAGANPRPLTAPGGLNHQPALSGDGELVAFVSDPDRDGRSDILLLSTETGGFQRLTPDAGPDMFVDHPAINQIGSRVIFAAANLGDTPQIYLAECQEIDLSIEKEVVGGSTRERGDLITYKLTLWNNDFVYDAQDVKVIDKLPPGLTYIIHTLSWWDDDYNYDPDSRTGVWTLKRLGRNNKAVLRVTAEITPQTSITLTNIVTATNNQPDPIPANNVATAIITVRSANLRVDKSVNNLTPRENDRIEYTVTVVNDGPYWTGEVKVEDELPAGVIYEDDVASQGNYDKDANIWTVDNMPAGRTATLRITATVSPTNTGGGMAITNTARIIKSSRFDPDPDNDSAAVSIMVNP